MMKCRMIMVLIAILGIATIASAAGKYAHPQSANGREYSEQEPPEAALSDYADATAALPDPGNSGPWFTTVLGVVIVAAGFVSGYWIHRLRHNAP